MAVAATTYLLWLLVDEYCVVLVPESSCGEVHAGAHLLLPPLLLRLLLHGGVCRGAGLLLQVASEIHRLGVFTLLLLQGLEPAPVLLEVCCSEGRSKVEVQRRRGGGGRGVGCGETDEGLEGEGRGWELVEADALCRRRAREVLGGRPLVGGRAGGRRNDCHLVAFSRAVGPIHSGLERRAAEEVFVVGESRRFCLLEACESRFGTKNCFALLLL